MSIKSIMMVLASYLLVGVMQANGKEPSIVFTVEQNPVKEIRLQDLQKGIATESIEIFDVIYKKVKRYKAVPLAKLMHLAYGADYHSDRFGSVAFIATDGYEAIADKKILSEEGAYLVISDLEFPGWETIPGYDGAKPGPFYLVWENPRQTPKKGFPWPWQIGAIKLISFEEQYANAVPRRTDMDASVSAGFKLFKKRCISCHAINKHGGDIGPDLGAPRNILSYRSENVLRSFIRFPSKYRYSKMPDFGDLTEQDLDQLMDYFWSLK